MDGKETSHNEKNYPPVVYLFYGDEFLVKEKVNKLVGELLEAELRDTNLIVLDGANLDLSEFSSLLFTASLFGTRRVLLVDQTTLFMGRGDQRGLVAKALDSWKAGDRKTAFKALAQLLSLSALDSRDLAQGLGWIDEILGDSPRPEEKETLARLAQAFLEEGKVPESRADEALVAELVASPFAEGTVLVFTATEVDKRKKLFKAVEKRGRVVECIVRQEKYGAGLDRPFFEERVREALGREGKEISSDALDKMYSRAGKEMRQLQSELEKLIRYVGTRRRISSEDVESLFSDFHEASFFDLTNALRTADITKCLPALHENLKLVSHPLQTIAAIANEFRRLIVARELLFTTFRSSWKPGMTYNNFTPLLKKVRDENPDLMRKGKFSLLSMKDYPLYLYLRDAQKFPMEKLVRIMEAILQADVMMKSSRLGAQSPQSILENLVFEICKSSRSKTVLGGKPAESRNIDEIAT